MTGGREDDAVDPDAEFVVVELEVDPERETTVDAEEVAEGERERGGGRADGASDDDEDADNEGVTDSVGGVAIGGVSVSVGNRCFLGRPRGRLTLLVVAGDAPGETVGTATGSLITGARGGTDAEVEVNWESLERLSFASVPMV